MNSALQMLGLCARAGRLASGQQAVESAIKAQKAYLVLMDGASSEGTQKAIQDACRFRGVPFVIMEKQSLGLAIGRPGRMLAAVTDSPFADRIRQLLTNGG